MNDISNFIKTIMQSDLESGKVKAIQTRFPPEPSAYLHLGHARAIITNFELAKVFSGKTNLRFDDTNPTAEDSEFVEAIIEDIKWLGYEPDRICFGSDYFEETYQYAVKLIKKGLAYVDDLSAEEISAYRGSLSDPGKPSPYRDRSVEENLRLFTEMRAGKYEEGEKVLRAKIDMAHPNMNMRDPILYRIIKAPHHRQGNKWVIYPMYDFAHPLQDAIEGITHSLCSIEFENHRILYDWVVDNCEPGHKPQQIEFGRLNITNMSALMSKRYLKRLVAAGIVDGFDDPRLPTLVGMKRRGYTPEAIKNFILASGLSRINSTVSSEMLEHFMREDLKLKAKRIMAVPNPLKVVLTNYPEGKIEYLTVPNNVEAEELGFRHVPFSKYLYIDRDDFCLTKPNKHYKRLALGLEVRLFHAYVIKAEEAVFDDEGNVIEVHCTYDPETRSGSELSTRKVNGIIHYVEATTALPARFNIFEPLVIDNPEDKRDLLERINPDSWIVKNGYVENAGIDYATSERFQFIRDGYYVVDKDSKPGDLVFNQIVPLKSKFR
jgi:glutaminyl-tRNA synthetase